MPTIVTLDRAVRVLVPSPQGPAGPPGPAFSGFGSVTFTESASTSAMPLAASTRTQLQFAPDSTQTDDRLAAPFSGHLFWTGTLIQGRALGDVLKVLVNLLVVSQVAGGKIRLDIDVGSSLGPIVTTTAALFEAAGVTERVTLETTIRSLSGLVTNGGAVYLTTTVPVSLTREAITIFPESAGAP